MLLLTWHGTILRVEQSQNRLIHAPLLPAREVARDLSFAPPADDHAGSIKLPGDMHLHAGPHPGGAHITRGGDTLSVDPQSPFPRFNAGPPSREATILALAEAEIAALRALLAGGYQHPESGAELPPATLEPGFILVLGSLRLNLLEERPVHTAEGVVLPGDAGVFAAVAAPSAPGEIPLRDIAPPETANEAAFHAAACASLVIHGEPEHAFLPVTGAFSTRDWFYTAGTQPPRVGTFTATDIIHQARCVFLLNHAGLRTMFTREGALHGAPASTDAPPYPPGVGREADHFFLSEAALTGVPVLEGPHALLPVPSTSALLDSILPLVLLAPYLPAATTLLLPDEDTDWASLLTLFGFASHNTAIAPSGVCQIERLIWPDACGPGQLSAATFAAARQRASLPPSHTAARLFLTEGLANAERLATVAAGFGFVTIATAPSDLTARAALFAGAEAMIAAHGAVLENLLFCPQGATVIELTPDSQWRDRYSLLAGLLGHTYAVLPCPAGDDGLTVEPQAFRRLLRIVGGGQ